MIGFHKKSRCVAFSAPLSKSSVSAPTCHTANSNIRHELAGSQSHFPAAAACLVCQYLRSAVCLGKPQCWRCRFHRVCARARARVCPVGLPSSERVPSQRFNSHLCHREAQASQLHRNRGRVAAASFLIPAPATKHTQSETQKRFMANSWMQFKHSILRRFDSSEQVKSQVKSSKVR
jgi:hypothetical protein